MAAGLDDIAVFHDQDQIGVADGGQTMRDHEAGAVFHQLLHALLDQHLRAGIDAGSSRALRRILGSAQEGAGNGEQLLLSLRDVAAFFIDHRLIAMVERADEMIHISGIRSPDDLFIRGIRTAIA